MNKLLIPLVLLSASAMADSIQVPMASMHFQDGDYNEINPGLIFERDLTDHFSLIGGAYLNSYSNTSIVAGGELQYGAFGVQAGLATGYEELHGHKLQPTGTLFSEFKLLKSKFRVSIIPHKEGAVVFSVVFALGKK